MDSCDIEVEEKISCSNLKCPDFEKWYTYSDVNIREAPEGEWYCSEGCRQIGCDSLEAIKKKISPVIDEAMDPSELIIRGPSRRAVAVKGREKIKASFAVDESAAVEVFLEPTTTKSKKRRMYEKIIVLTLIFSFKLLSELMMYVMYEYFFKLGISSLQQIL